VGTNLDPCSLASIHEVMTTCELRTGGVGVNPVEIEGGLPNDMLIQAKEQYRYTRTTAK
jgi:hypothetical protein